MSWKKGGGLESQLLYIVIFIITSCPGKFKGYSGEDQQISLEDLVSLLHSVDHDEVVSNGDAVISDEALEALLDRSVGTEGKGNGAIKAAGGEGSGRERDGGKHGGVFKVILEQDSTRNVLQTVDESGDGKKSDSREQITGTDITAEGITAEGITGTNITGTAITGTDITCTTITGTTITGTDITGTDITGTDITCTDITGTDITGTDITGTDITGTTITGTDITGTNITGTTITGTDITCTTITGTTITGTDITGATITCTDITGTTITAEGSGVDAENIKPKQMLADVADPPPAETKAI